MDADELRDAVVERARAVWSDALAWCREDRLWQPRAALVAFFAYALVQHLRNPYYQTIVGALNFGIHELGHFVFRPFGELMGVAGGSLFQCLVPLIGLGMFWKQRDYFAMSFAIGWLGTNLFYVSLYCADARDMQLPLLSPGGGDAYHDWNYLLDRFGLIARCGLIAGLFKLAAVASTLAFLGIGGRLVWEMARPARPSSSSPPGSGRAG